MRGTRLRLLIKSTTQHSIMKLLLILCFLPLLVQAQWHDTLQQNQFRRLKIQTMEKYESIQRNDKTSEPKLISVAYINPLGYITQVLNHSSCAQPSLQYENTYHLDSILVETQVPGIGPGGLTSVMKYTYLPNGSIDIGRMYFGDLLVSTIQHIYSEDNRLGKIKQTWHPDTLTYNYKGTEEKSFVYNERNQLIEMQEKRRINGLTTKDVYQYIYDLQGNIIETYIRTKQINTRTFLEKRTYDQQNRLIEEERYYQHKFINKKGKDLWSLQPCEVIKKKWTYNDRGLIDKEYRRETEERTVIISYSYKP